jgi:hypothetical protein
MEIGASEFQEWGHCCDEQSEEKKKELTTVLKEYKKRGDEECQEQIL